MHENKITKKAIPPTLKKYDSVRKVYGIRMEYCIKDKVGCGRNGMSQEGWDVAGWKIDSRG